MYCATAAVIKGVGADRERSRFTRSIVQTLEYIDMEKTCTEISLVCTLAKLCLKFSPQAFMRASHSSLQSSGIEKSFSSFSLFLHPKTVQRRNIVDISKIV